MPPSGDSALLLTTLLDYFQGEKIEALVFILPVGLASLAFGAWLLVDNPTAFTRGIAIPFLLMGLLMGTVGAVVGYRAPAQVKALQTAVVAADAPALQAELSRMQTVNKAWPRYLVLWAAFGLGGLALRFVFGSAFLQGLGAALVFFAGVGLLVDGFAERRTHAYTAALEDSVSKAAERP